MKKVVACMSIILILALGFGMSVMAFSSEDGRTCREYGMVEKAYVEEVRQILLEKGCKDAGITLTYITDGEGNRDYTITLHHRKIKKMKDNEWSILQARIKETGEKFFIDSKVEMVKILSDIR